MEGASGKEHQRGCLQLHPGGARGGTSALLPTDPQWRTKADQVPHVYALHIITPHVRVESRDLWAELDMVQLTDWSKQIFLCSSTSVVTVC